MRLAGTELPPSSTLTAADAAAGYEELVKSQKQASPTKTGKGARNRPASGVSLSAQHAVGKQGPPSALRMLLHAGSCPLGRLRLHVCGLLLVYIFRPNLRDHKIEKPKQSMVMLPVGYDSRNNRVVPQVERQRNAWKLAGEVKPSRTERISSRPSAAAGSHHESRWAGMAYWQVICMHREVFPMRHTSSKWHVTPLKRTAELNCADCTCLYMCKCGFIQARLSVKTS